MNKYTVETLIAASAVKRGTIEMPEQTYGSKFNKAFKSLLMKRAKASMGLTDVEGMTEDWGDYIAFIPYGRDTVMYINRGTLGQSYLRHW